jgi:hypothetical protein
MDWRAFGAQTGKFTLEGEDAVALQRIAEDQGERPGEVVRSLIRAASVKAA